MTKLSRLDFAQKIKVKEWLEKNHERVNRDVMSRQQCAQAATKELGFTVTEGHLPGIVATIEGKAFRFRGRTKSFESTKRLQAAEAKIVSLEAKTTALETEIVGLREGLKALMRELGVERLNMAIGGLAKAA